MSTNERKVSWYDLCYNDADDENDLQEEHVKQPPKNVIQMAKEQNSSEKGVDVECEGNNEFTLANKKVDELDPQAIEVASIKKLLETKEHHELCAKKYNVAKEKIENLDLQDIKARQTQNQSPKKLNCFAKEFKYEPKTIIYNNIKNDSAFQEKDMESKDIEIPETDIQFAKGLNPFATKFVPRGVFIADLQTEKIEFEKESIAIAQGLNFKSQDEQSGFKRATTYKKPESKSYEIIFREAAQNEKTKFDKKSLPFNTQSYYQKNGDGRDQLQGDTRTNMYFEMTPYENYDNDPQNQKQEMTNNSFPVAPKSNDQKARGNRVRFQEDVRTCNNHLMHSDINPLKNYDNAMQKEMPELANKSVPEAPKLNYHDTRGGSGRVQGSSRNFKNDSIPSKMTDCENYDKPLEKEKTEIANNSVYVAPKTNYRGSRGRFQGDAIDFTNDSMPSENTPRKYYDKTVRKENPEMSNNSVPIAPKSNYQNTHSDRGRFHGSARNFNNDSNHSGMPYRVNYNRTPEDQRTEFDNNSVTTNSDKRQYRGARDRFHGSIKNNDADFMSSQMTLEEYRKKEGVRSKQFNMRNSCDGEESDERKHVYTLSGKEIIETTKNKKGTKTKPKEKNKQKIVLETDFYFENKNQNRHDDSERRRNFNNRDPQSRNIRPFNEDGVAE